MALDAAARRKRIFGAVGLALLFLASLGLNASQTANRCSTTDTSGGSKTTTSCNNVYFNTFYCIDYSFNVYQIDYNSDGSTTEVTATCSWTSNVFIINYVTVAVALVFAVAFTRPRSFTARSSFWIGISAIIINAVSIIRMALQIVYSSTHVDWLKAQNSTNYKYNMNTFIAQVVINGLSIIPMALFVYYLQQDSRKEANQVNQATIQNNQGYPNQPQIQVVSYPPQQQTPFGYQPQQQPGYGYQPQQQSQSYSQQPQYSPEVQGSFR